MFAAKNPFEDIVVRATAEDLTSENWELNLEICDRVSSEGELGARNCINAIQKRLIHRNPNVQLYALTLADTLAKNCGIQVHQEIASRAFTQTLSRISLDRNTHATVKKRSTALVKQWAAEFDDDSLGIMRETYDVLRQQNVDFGDEPEPEGPEPSSEQLRAEDEELRRVLELSVQDQGGRANWVASYPSETPGQSSSSAVASASGSRADAPATASSSAAPSSHPATAPTTSTTSYGSGYTQGASGSALSASTSSSAAAAPSQQQPPQQQQSADAAAAPVPVASRVRALYDFSPTEPGELAFIKGDVIRVLDSVYEHWWRGEVRGEAGIFPVNYVEILPDPTPEEMQREAEMEARIFSQAANIDRLLSKLRSLDPARDNLTEDEELQELYQTSLAMRPKIVKLIDRYSTKIAELQQLNDKFVRARGTFDELMEQSLARYNPGGQSAQDYLRPRPEYVQHASSASVPTQAHGQPQAPYDYAAAAGPHAGAYGQPYPGAATAGGGHHASYGSANPHLQQQQPQQQPQQPHQPQPQQPHQSHHAQQPSQADYAQWYHAQQQQQQHALTTAPQHLGVSSSGPVPPQHAQPRPQAQSQVQAHYSPSPHAAAAGPSGASPAPILTTAAVQEIGAVPHDDEKRRLYERARAESEAFQQQYFNNPVAGASAPAGSSAGQTSTYAQQPAHHPNPQQLQQAQQADGVAAVVQGVAGMRVGY
ncbi:hypothetical protein ACQY0O_005138 [Thecaphora frezii]